MKKATARTWSVVSGGILVAALALWLGIGQEDATDRLMHTYGRVYGKYLVPEARSPKTWDELSEYVYANRAKFDESGIRDSLIKLGWHAVVDRTSGDGLRIIILGRSEPKARSQATIVGSPQTRKFIFVGYSREPHFGEQISHGLAKLVGQSGE